MKTKAETAAGRIALRHPDACACSVAGRVYVADEHGMFLVPAEAVTALAAHGFVPVAPAPEMAPE